MGFAVLNALTGNGQATQVAQEEESQVLDRVLQNIA